MSGAGLLCKPLTVDCGASVNGKGSLEMDLDAVGTISLKDDTDSDEEVDEVQTYFRKSILNYVTIN